MIEIACSNPLENETLYLAKDMQVTAIQHKDSIEVGKNFVKLFNLEKWSEINPNQNVKVLIELLESALKE